MVVSNHLPSVAACPPKVEGWTPLSSMPLAILNDKATTLLAKGLPLGNLCQKTGPSPGATSYFVRADAMHFATLLLTPPTGNADVDIALALVTARRHPEPEATAQLVAFEKNPPTKVDPELAGIEWLVVDANLTPSLMTFIRHEMNDSDNVLFRQAQRGASYYVTRDTEKISRMVSVLQEAKRDLSEIAQQEVAGDVNEIAVQLTYVQTHLQASQAFWNKPLRELWPLTVVGVFLGLGAGYLFGEGLELVQCRKQLFAKIAEWIHNNRNPPSAGAGGGGGASAPARVDPVSDAEFSSVDNREDAGEQADFQIDPTRAYDPIQHIHINGTAIAAVVVAGGVLLLLPELLPVLAATSPETVTLVTGLGAFAAAH